MAYKTLFPVGDDFRVAADRHGFRLSRRMSGRKGDRHQWKIEGHYTTFEGIAHGLAGVASREIEAATLQGYVEALQEAINALATASEALAACCTDAPPWVRTLIERRAARDAPPVPESATAPSGHRVEPVSEHRRRTAGTAAAEPGIPTALVPPKRSSKSRKGGRRPRSRSAGRPRDPKKCAIGRREKTLELFPD